MWISVAEGLLVLCILVLRVKIYQNLLRVSMTYGNL